MTPHLSSFWLALLLVSVAIDQSKADGGLAPQDRERSVQIPQLSDIQMDPAAPKQQQDLEPERYRSDELRRELASVRVELEAARAQALEAQALLEEQRSLAAGGQELALMRRVAEGLARDLALAQRVRDDAFAARDGAQVSLLGTRQMLEEERQKVEHLERDLAEAQRSAEALEANARLAAITQTGAMRPRQPAEAGARQAGEALARERERAGSLATDLETARRERDAAKEELTRISEAFEKAWEQEHEKTVDLTRDLVAARKDIDALKGQLERRTSRIENAAKARPTDHASARAEQRKSARLQKVGAQMRKSEGVRLTTIVLPDELLPTRPPVKGFPQ
jgi:hypothetical protein